MLSNTEKNQKAIIVNQSHAEDAADIRAEIANENAEERHDVAEDNAYQRHNQNCNQHGTTRKLLAYGLTLCIGGFVALLVLYLGNRKDLETANINLEKEKVTTAGLVISHREKDAAMIHLLQQHDEYKKLQGEYYHHKDERAEGLIDHVMLLNEQLEKAQIDCANAEMEADAMGYWRMILHTVMRDNPKRLANLVGEGFVGESYYPKTVEIALAFQSYGVLEFIQTLDGWDGILSDKISQQVINPIKFVPMSEFKKLKAGYDQQAGRIADLEARKLNAESVGEMEIFKTLSNIAKDMNAIKEDAFRKSNRKEKKRIEAKSEKFKADPDTLRAAWELECGGE
jgi:hypothetical protein